MSDFGHDFTDDVIDALSRRMAAAYEQAAREMAEKLKGQMKDYADQCAEWEARIASGKATPEDYEAWRKDRAVDRKFVSGLADALARDATDTDRLARATINDEIPMVYAENANYAAYGIETTIGWDTHSFDLYDVSTVRRLIDEEPNLVPMVEIDGKKDYRWNRQKFSSAITQSVLQGESIPDTAKRLKRVLGMDERASVSAARTGMTSAENAGRVDSYKRAQKIGIQLEQEWMATLDERTRLSHRKLDGEHVPIGEKFSNDLRYPADPEGEGNEVWNCRCTLVAWSPEIAEGDAVVKRFSRLPKDMSYEDWKEGKKKESESKKKTQPKKTQPKKKTFAEMIDECKTSAEVGKVMDGQGWWKSTSSATELNGVDVVAAKKLAETYQRIFDLFPVLKGQFLAPDTGEDHPRAYASCTYATGKVHLNTKVSFAFASWDALQRTYGADVRDNWHPAGTSGMAVIIHELGHAIDGWMRQFTFSKAFLSEVGDPSSDAAIKREWGDPWAATNGRYSFANALRAKAIKEATGKRFTNAIVNREVSEYATENATEFFSETFAEFIDSEHPRRVAKAFGEELQRLLKEREKIEKAYQSKIK